MAWHRPLLVVVTTLMLLLPTATADTTAPSPTSTIASPVASPLAAGSLPGDQLGTAPVSLMVRNRGQEADRLLGGESPIAERVEVVASEGFGAHRRLRRLEDGVAIPPDQVMLFEPAATHLLLVGLNRDLVQGQTVPLTLRFERGGEVPVTVRIRRKLDAAGVAPIPPVTVGAIEVSLVSVPPAGGAP